MLIFWKFSRLYGTYGYNTLVQATSVLLIYFLPPANEVCEGIVFTRVCLSTGGTCMAGEACMFGRGHAWQGCAWQGACMEGGVHGRGHGMHAPPKQIP